MIENNISKSSLIITVNSFGYRKSGIPDDKTGHGGGYVFDCRALPNPGRDPSMETLTGLDTPVIEFLSALKSVHFFLNHTFDLIEFHAQKYLERQFSHLMVSFGCTGGQHRSVYCAEQTAVSLKKNGYRVTITHKDMIIFV